MADVLSRNVEVRRYGAADQDFVAALAALAFRDFERNPALTTLRMLRPPAATLVALRGDEPAGFVIVEPHGGAFASIQAIAVAPGERCRGVGARLLRAALLAARRAGAREVRLCTAQANVEALSLFLKHGFVIVRRMPRFYPRGQDACLLARKMEDV
jgi:ribosomal protein S18 acetylase RimI-like enzyme